MIVKAYPWSFDVLHNGHIATIEDAAKSTDQLHVLIGKNPKKSGLFPVETRLNHLKQATKHLPNVLVGSFDGLLVDHMMKRGITHPIGGERDLKDREFLDMQTFYNRWLSPEIFMEFIPCRPEYYHVSSSAIKELIARWGNISQTSHLLPLYVKKATEEALNNQFMLWITGVPGSGKSYIMQQFATYCEELSIPHYALQMDTLRHQIAFSNDPDFFQHLRDQVVATFPTVTKASWGNLSRESLRETFLGNKPRMEQLEQMTKQSLMSLLRSTLWQKQWAIFVESALFAEQPHLLPIVNNDMLVVEADKSTQYQRIRDRNPYYDTQTKIDGLVNLQSTTDKKVATIKDVVAHDGQGSVQLLDNSSQNNQDTIYQGFLASMNQIDPGGKLYFQGLWKKLHGKWDRKVAYTALTQWKMPRDKVYTPVLKHNIPKKWLKYLASLFDAKYDLLDRYATYIIGKE